ncbi:putative acyl transferase [uncultured Alphaproteobacteria bacterium]|uniref:Putative acyl transferase n=1 Tax=uncultured Alphaproteobacteria bacterium TaxID=91750 RepID=A0A212KDP8_9PROT|nr:putative acyl transferase [uncultured Alphaproteobacteria bacterium]
MYSPILMALRHFRQEWKHVVRVYRLSRRFGCEISPKTRLTGPDASLQIGPGTCINAYCNLRFRQGHLTMGRHVLLAQSVTILTSTHRIADRDIPIMHQGSDIADVVIEDDVWIGVNAVIMPGVRIGKGAVIGANSVVTRDVGSYEIWAGIPAAKIRDR